MKAKLAVVIMAAGKGTRMKNPDVAKVMYTVAGRPMVDHVIDLALRLESARTIVIVGWQKDSVVSHIADHYPSVMCVEQKPQLGTGHAVMQSRSALDDYEGDVLVLSGDVPLLSEATARTLIDAHRASGLAATILTAVLDDAAGYGRILRDGGGRVTGIVEHSDATVEQRWIQEINSGIYVFRSGALFSALQEIRPANAQKEYYLTDVFRSFQRNNLPFSAVKTTDPLEIRGVNTPQQLEEARSIFTHKR